MRAVRVRALRSRIVLAACAAAVVVAALFAGAGLADGMGNHSPDTQTSSVQDITR